MKILCSLQTFVTVASFVQWRLQIWTYFPDKTQSIEFLRWYLMIISIYKLQYIWICCQFLLQLLKLIFNVIKTGLISPPSPWELIQSCRWMSGITSWACCQSLLPLLKLIFNFIEKLPVRYFSLVSMTLFISGVLQSEAPSQCQCSFRCKWRISELLSDWKGNCQLRLLHAKWCK